MPARLNLVGAPLMILPALIGRNLLPDLVAQNRTADVYVLLVMRLLPAGMVGIIMAAMFSATMAMVSADFNAIASVLTKDVYQRLISPAASERRLVTVGRWTTLGLGVATTLLGTGDRPHPPAVAVQRHGHGAGALHGAHVSAAAGRACGAQAELAGRPAGLCVRPRNRAWRCWRSRPGGCRPIRKMCSGPATIFEGVSLLANAAATVLGMALGTWWFKRRPDEAARVSSFFAALDQPIRPDEVPAVGENPSAPVLGVCTIGVGLLLMVAGLISGSTTARIVDTAVGLVLLLIGLRFRRSRRAHGSGAATL